MEPAERTSRLGRLGRLCARRHVLVVVVALAALAAVTVGHRALGGIYSDDFTLPGTSAQQGADLLAAHDPAVGGQGGQLVFSSTGALSKQRAAIERAVANVRALPDVLSVGDPLSPGTTAPDGRVAYANVNFSVNPTTLGHDYVVKVDRATDGARAAGVGVDYGGLLGQAARPAANDARSELIGIGVALVVLVVGFGSIAAAGLPVGSALIGAFTGLGVLGMVAATTSFASVSPTLAIMLGLGVGIDYALFLTTRHRQQVMDGVAPVDAAGHAVQTSGHAVLIAATTVIIALLGLYVSGIGFIGKLGLAAAIAVAVSALLAMTLVPALLGWLGRGIDRVHVRPPVAEASPEHAGWQRYAERIGAHPWRYLLIGLAGLAVLAVPAFSMRLGHIDAGADPTSYTDRRAYDAVRSGFGVGANGPLTVVVALDRAKTDTTSAVQTLESSLHGALAAVPDVASVTPVKASPDGALLYATVIPRSGPQDSATITLHDTLLNTTLPAALARTGATGYVSGTLAANLDFRDLVASRLWLIIATVVAAAFILLLVSFGSPVLAAKAAALNLLSIGASYGVIVAVFQWGWGGSALGVAAKVPIESYVPMIVFAIVFGLSMDYEVFLLTRMRENWLRTHDNHAGVAGGLAATARVISAAALIMASVFLAFLLSTDVVVKILALGLGVSVLIDATVIRLVIVPASMYLFGTANWWTPRWLRRLGIGGPAPAEPNAGPELPAADDEQSAAA